MNTQEEGNTIEINISTHNTDWRDCVEEVMLTLSERFDNANGYFSITVEFIPEESDE